jgi:uracil-DNA glycosylase family 4
MVDDIDWTELDCIADDQCSDAAFAALRNGYAYQSTSNGYVSGEGDNPRAMVIGEAPSAQEAIRGRPFVGPAGNVLRQLMHVAGLHTGTGKDIASITNGNCWLTNTIKFRPPGNRKPTAEEVSAARPYLLREWQAIGKPRVIVLVGGTALWAITGKEQSILRAAGKMHIAKSNTDGQPLFVWPMVHPTFGLQNPVVQPLLEQDWQKLGEWLASDG